MFELQKTGRFKKDYKKVQHDSEVKKELNIVLKNLVVSGEVPKKYKPHKLKGNYKNNMECHVLPDMLLIWQKKQNIITLVRLGSHSELF